MQLLAEGCQPGPNLSQQGLEIPAVLQDVGCILFCVEKTQVFLERDEQEACDGFMKNTDCPALDTSLFSVTSETRTVGAAVNVSCTAFGHRVVGARALTCNTSSLWEPAVPTCEWTWDFTTHEKVVLGTAVGCAAFIIIIAIVTIITCCCCRRRREEKEYNDLMYGDNPGFVTAPGDSGGVYPDAYFAYQDMGDKQMNGNPATMDRAWLGYIPRPKVAEGHYYH
ncbi:uncharacterized protein [Littorina saxatilis]|uniref:uncharacterized protein n=1 Tax=Littorina saxatilis TaxID=31220 RepID=UPI0038B69A90